jgi:excisionase family DNA binding protein
MQRVHTRQAVWKLLLQRGDQLPYRRRCHPYEAQIIRNAHQVHILQAVEVPGALPGRGADGWLQFERATDRPVFGTAPGHPEDGDHLSEFEGLKGVTLHAGAHMCYYILSSAILHHFNQQDPPLQQLLIGIREAAAAIGLSPWTVRQYIRDGKIKAVRIGRRVLVEPSELENLIAAARYPGQSKVA